MKIVKINKKHKPSFMKRYPPKSKIPKGKKIMVECSLCGIYKYQYTCMGCPFSKYATIMYLGCTKWLCENNITDNGLIITNTYIKINNVKKYLKFRNKAKKLIEWCD